MYDLKVDSKTVIPAGSQAKGQIVLCQAAKGMGKPGKLSIEPKHLVAPDGTIIDLSGSPVQYNGEDKSTIAWVAGAAGLLLTCIGGVAVFLIKGGEAEILPGASIDCNVSTDVEISI